MVRLALWLLRRWVRWLLSLLSRRWARWGRWAPSARSDIAADMAGEDTEVGMDAVRKAANSRMC